MSPSTAHPGSKGRVRSVLAPGFLLGQVIKSYAHRGGTAVSQRAVSGSMAAIMARVQATGGTMIHTAYLERLNATFRSRWAGLVRRTRCRLRREHGTRQWQERTPAMAAGLTEHVWTVAELRHYRVPPKRIDLARWRGKHRKGALPTPRSASRGVQTATTV